MKNRSRKYFKERRLKKRLGITSWHLDWMKMQLPDKPVHNMDFIMPAYAPLQIKYIDPVIPLIQYPSISLTDGVKWMNEKWEHLGVFTVGEDNKVHFVEHPNKFIIQAELSKEFLDGLFDKNKNDETEK